MEPRIRYIKTPDGASLATASIGNGPPLLMLMPTGLGSIEASFATPDTQRGIAILAEHFTFITYDPRGQGLSERNMNDFTLERRVADLAAVMDGLDLNAVNLLARGPHGATGIAYAATNSTRVRALALWASTARGRDFSLGEKLRTVAPLIEADWPLYCQILSLIDFGWTDAARVCSEYLVKSITPEAFSEQWVAARATDATAYVNQVRCPTLIVYPQSSDARRVSFEATRTLAASIPGAEFRTGESLSLFAFVGPGAENDARVVVDFFTKGSAIDSTAGPSGTAIILFADIADSTALTERLGDAAFREKARDLDEALRRAITSNGGVAIDGKLLGDGVLATFGAAREAIACAEACHVAAANGDLSLHVGIHAGDVIREADPDGRSNVYGGAVNIASRIADESAAGETLVSTTVRDLARTSAAVSFEDRGERELKGVGEPVRVFAVRSEG